MHWTLLRFHSPLLATSDHPVVSWPAASTSRRPNTPIKFEGQLLTIETRFPVSPQLALLMTWFDGPDGEAEIIDVRRDHARHVNAFTIGQAANQWFLPPSGVAPNTTGRLLPLSPRLLAGYDAHAVGTSQRRAEAQRLIEPLMGQNFPRAVPTVGVERKPVISSR